MKNCVLLLLLLKLFISNVKSQIYSANWTDLNSRPNPGWYDEAKFGIFIHFGVYSVPAYTTHSYAEWYWYYLNNDNGTTQQWQNEHYGQQFRYQDFAPMFNCRFFDPDEWASIFQKSGAKYVVLTSKHHEGYTLWNSDQAWNWNSVQNGPGIDIVGELTNSVKKQGLHMGLYHSLYEWYNPLYLSDKASGSPPTQNDYVREVLSPQLRDIVLKYEPDIIWADGEWEQYSNYWNSTEFISWLYNESPVKDTVLVNDRWGKETRGVDGGFFTGGDHWQPGHLVSHKWENCETIGYSYGYDENEPATAYQNSTVLIQEFVETVACGGNFLLDVGPNAEGLIPNNMVDRLYDIGLFLSINGESIYGSSPWRIQNQTESIWFTTNSETGSIYAFCYYFSDDGIFEFNEIIGNENTVVELLGYKGNKPITVDVHKLKGIKLTVPFVSPSDYPPFIYVFKFINAN
ncbi:hypothetical protein RB653_002829 [Dictyostelium firmibasis]|uniref:alpha-L-fucosidase n=1 Tax=Dictyostelium firmibasis TaxID=79012 RepID=A0AAN7YT27_9MYCE